jgi:N-acetylglucosaminyl-diphospho-decaprenol L-rhamnosyltransferase
MLQTLMNAAFISHSPNTTARIASDHAQGNMREETVPAGAAKTVETRPRMIGIVRPDLDVVVITHNSSHVVHGLLDSLPDALADVVADVVVVDNASTDDTVEQLKRRGDCRVVLSANVGYAAGINKGVAEAKPANAILVLNPDVRLTPGCVPFLMEALTRPKIGIAAPQVRSLDGELDYTLRREPTVRRALGLNWTNLPMFSEYVGRPEEYAQGRTVDWAVGAVLLISRACFEAVGGWDESYFLYSEETDFCLRARDLGFGTRYEPTAVAIHIGGQSGRTGNTHAMQIVNRVRVYRRRHSMPAAWAYYWASIASEFSWALRGQSRSWFAIQALLRPARRPRELGCGDRLLPV